MKTFTTLTRIHIIFILFIINENYINKNILLTIKFKSNNFDELNNFNYLIIKIISNILSFASNILFSIIISNF